MISASTVAPGLQLPINRGWSLYLEHCGRAEVLGGGSPGTVKRYRAVQDKHIAYCRTQGIVDWRDFDSNAAKKYATHLSNKYPYRTVYLELTTLKSATLWLIGEKHLPETCRLKVELKKPQGTDTYCYSRTEVMAMVEHCRATPSLCWLRDVIVALACTGLRIGELASLLWTDIELSAVNPAIRLTDDRASRRKKQLGQGRRLKSGRDRSLPIHPQLLEVLQAMKKAPDGRIFHGPKNGRLKPDTVRNVFIREVLEPLKGRFPTPASGIGFSDGRLHSFRHFFCSQCFADGVPETDIREWLGHSESRMVAHYRHVADADSQRRMRQIDFLGPDVGHGA